MNRFLIVEDIPETGEWLKERLHNAWGAAIHVDTALTLQQARRKLADNIYHLVLLDIGLPDGSGIQLLQQQATTPNAPDYIMTTIHNDDQHIFSALRSGAKGYLLKDAPAADIEQALRNYKAGIPPLSPTIAIRMMEYFSQEKNTTAAILTERECLLLTHLAKGDSVQEAAEKLRISVHTARGYVKEIYRKLGISSRAEASVKASQMGLI